MLRAALVLLGVGAVMSAISLVYHAPTFCTASARGWPFGIVVYPCLCYGMGDVEWFVDPFGLLLDTLFFTGAAGALWLLVVWMRNRKPRRRAAFARAPALAAANPNSEFRNPHSP